MPWTCCTAPTGCPFKSYESQKIQSSQRFMYHGSGAGVDDLNASKLESVLAGRAGSVREFWTALVEWLALEVERL